MISRADFELNYEDFKIRFSVLQELSSQGLIFLQRGVDNQTKERVFIQEYKVEQLDLSENNKDQIRESLQKLSGIEHPNLPMVLAWSFTRTSFYLAVEGVDGQFLDKLQFESLSRSFALFIAFQLLSALKFLHRNNLVHGHLRPSVLWLDSQGQLKLLYLSLIPGSSLDFPFRELINGLPGYSPPEVWTQNDCIDVVSDIFGWAAVFYFCVTDGRHPPRVLTPSKIPARYRSVILKARASRKTDRFSSVDQVESALFGIRQGEENLDCEDFYEEKPFSEVGFVSENLEKKEIEWIEEDEKLNQEKSDNHVNSFLNSDPVKAKLSRLSAPVRGLFEDLKTAIHYAKEDLDAETAEISKKIREKKEKSENLIEEEIVSVQEKIERKKEGLVKAGKGWLRRQIRRISGPLQKGVIGIFSALIFYGFYHLYQMTPQTTRVEVILPPPSSSVSSDLKSDGFSGEVIYKKAAFEAPKAFSHSDSLHPGAWIQTMKDSQMILSAQSGNIRLTLFENAKMEIRGLSSTKLGMQKNFQFYVEEGNYHLDCRKSRDFVEVENLNFRFATRASMFEMSSDKSKGVLKVYYGAVKMEFSGQSIVISGGESIEVIQGKPGKKSRI